MCTRVLWNTNGLAVLTGRSMDWPESTQPLIVAFPLGRQRDGFQPAGVGNDPNPLRWTSRYASLVTTIYGVGTIDGLNSAGLAGHGLYLQATDFGTRNPARPAVQTTLWLQYLLDRAATVEEALALLSQQDFTHPSRDMPLPGNVNAVDRFQRAAYYSALLPKPDSEREAVASVMAIMRNVSVPFGAPYAEFGVYNTEYRTVTDLTNRMYFFELTTSPNVIWVQMDRLNLTEGAPALAVDPYDETLVGDVTDRFAPREMAF